MTFFSWRREVLKDGEGVELAHLAWLNDNFKLEASHPDALEERIAQYEAPFIERKQNEDAVRRAEAAENARMNAGLGLSQDWNPEPQEAV